MNIPKVVTVLNDDSNRRPPFVVYVDYLIVKFFLFFPSLVLRVCDKRKIEIVERLKREKPEMSCTLRETIFFLDYIQ